METWNFPEAGHCGNWGEIKSSAGVGLDSVDFSKQQLLVFAKVCGKNHEVRCFRSAYSSDTGTSDPTPGPASAPGSASSSSPSSSSSSSSSEISASENDPMLQEVRLWAEQEVPAGEAVLLAILRKGMEPEEGAATDEGGVLLEQLIKVLKETLGVPGSLKGIRQCACFAAVGQKKEEGSVSDGSKSAWAKGGPGFWNTFASHDAACVSGAVILRAETEGGAKNEVASRPIREPIED